MSKQITFITALSAVIAATVLMAAGTAQAAPAKEGVVTLPRVVITGKATQVQQLPTVVVTGYSIEGQLRRQMLAQAKPARRI